MHSLKMGQLLMQRVRERGSTITPRPSEPILPYETICQGGTNTYLIHRHDLVQNLLARRSLAQPPITAIQTICGHFGTDPNPIEQFFSLSPIFLEGEEHRQARRLFATHIQQAATFIRPKLSHTAETHFRRLSQRRTGDLAQHGVIDFVDDVFRMVFEKYLPEQENAYPAIAHHPQSIFEIAHHPKRLLGTVTAMEPYLGRNPGYNLNPTEAALLLGFALMGRDPLIGGLTDYLRTLRPLSSKDRADQLEAVTSQQLFRNTSAVNYITRVATEPFVLEDMAIRPGDLIVCMLMNVRSTPESDSTRNLAFGHGHHKCAGQALSIAIADAFLEHLRDWHDQLPWPALDEREPDASVFRRYRSTTGRRT